MSCNELKFLKIQMVTIFFQFYGSEAAATSSDRALASSLHLDESNPRRFNQQFNISYQVTEQYTDRPIVRLLIEESPSLFIQNRPRRYSRRSNVTDRGSESASPNLNTRSSCS